VAAKMEIAKSLKLETTKISWEELLNENDEYDCEAYDNISGVNNFVANASVAIYNSALSMVNFSNAQREVLSDARWLEIIDAFCHLSQATTPTPIETRQLVNT
jgi:hypothetical protein